MSDSNGVRNILIAHPSPELYGSDRVLIESVAGLTARGHRVFVTLPISGPLVQAMENVGAQVQILEVPVLRKSLLRPRAFAKFVVDSIRSINAGGKLIRRIRPSAVVVNTATIPIWILTARLMGLPVLIHIHESERNAHRLQRLALAAPATLCRTVILNSDYSTESLLQVAPWLKKKSTVVYNGVPGPEHMERPRENLSSPVRVLFVGRLSERKGAHTAVQAMHTLQQRGKNIQLDLLGAVYEGNEWFEDQLRRDVSVLPHPEQVNFLGFQSPVWPHYEACDLAIVPSTMDEPFGNTAVEAVLAQRPVVVSRIGGLPEAVSGLESAVLVAADDPEALADGISSIIDSWSVYCQSAGPARELAEARYDPNTYGEAFAKHVEALMPRVRPDLVSKRAANRR